MTTIIIMIIIFM